MSVYSQGCTKFLQQLIQIPSVNGENTEEEVVQCIIRTCNELSLPYTIYEKEPGRPNIFVGEHLTDPAKLLFVSHSDTVPNGDESKRTHPPFGGIIHDDKLYGRGALDCKGGIATSLYALKVLYDTGYGHTAKMLVGVDEESGANSTFGIQHVLSQGLVASGAIYTYGGSDDRTDINIGHRGLLRMRIDCNGHSMHAGAKKRSTKETGANAIEELLSLVRTIQQLPFVSHPLFPGYNATITPTLFSGGEGESIVPGAARVLLDIRTLPTNNNAHVLRQIEELITEASRDNVSYEITIKNDIPAALSAINAPIISCTKEILQTRFGKKENEITIKGSGPANESYLLIQNGIPTIAGFGPRGSGLHEINEHLVLDSISDSIMVLNSIAKKMH